MESPTPASPPPRPPGRPGLRRRWPRIKARTRTVWRRLLTLLGPIVLTALLLWGVSLLFSPRIASELLVISAASLLWAGTTVILAPAVLGTTIHLGTWDIAVWMIWMNAAAAYLYAYNLDLLEKIPVIGPYLRRARRNARASLEHHPWIRRLAEFGVAVFVLSPLPGSGQLGGCFIGRVLGLPRRTVFLVVTLAGVSVAVLYALFGNYIQGILDHAEIGVWVRVCGAVGILVLCWFLFRLLKYLGREEAPERGQDAPGPDPDDPAS